MICLVLSNGLPLEIPKTRLNKKLNILSYLSLDILLGLVQKKHRNGLMKLSENLQLIEVVLRNHCKQQNLKYYQDIGIKLEVLSYKYERKFLTYNVFIYK